jgi:hypothetical protein
MTESRSCRLNNQDHDWEFYRNVEHTPTTRPFNNVYKCKVCGALQYVDRNGECLLKHEGKVKGGE